MGSDLQSIGTKAGRAGSVVEIDLRTAASDQRRFASGAHGALFEKLALERRRCHGYGSAAGSLFADLRRRQESAETVSVPRRRDGIGGAIGHEWAINLGGGFHHCSADRGGGFCAYADITLALEFLFAKGAIQRAMIVDLDAHQGNGHELDFTNDQRVYILDMYNAYIYPHDSRAKRVIRKRVELDFGTKTKEYLILLRNALAEALNEFGRPDLILYNAGTDCLIGDPLGGLDVTPDGIAQRDRLVFETARSRPDPIPVIMVTSGGYQRNNADIIADSIINLHKCGLIAGPG